MSDFPIHNINTAPAATQQALAQVQGKYGFVPNLIGALAEAPAALDGYLKLASILETSSLSPQERQLLALTASRANDCDYCLAAHTPAAKAAKVPQQAIDAASSGGHIDDPKLEAFRVFVDTLVRKRGWADQDDLAAFLEAGYSQQQALEVVTGIAWKTLSNYANHLIDTPIDKPFQQAAA